MLKKFTKKSIVPFFIALPVLAVSLVAGLVLLLPSKVFAAPAPTVTAEFTSNDRTIDTLTIYGLEPGYYHIKLPTSSGWDSDNLSNLESPNSVRDIHKVTGASLVASQICQNGQFPRNNCGQPFAPKHYTMKIFKCYVPLDAVKYEDVGDGNRCEDDPEGDGSGRYELYGTVSFPGPNPDSDLKNYTPRVREAKLVYQPGLPLYHRIKEMTIIGLTPNRYYAVQLAGWGGNRLLNKDQPVPKRIIFSGTNGTIVAKDVCANGEYGTTSGSCGGLFLPKYYEMYFWVCKDGSADSNTVGALCGRDLTMDDYFAQGGVVRIPGPLMAEFAAKQPTYSPQPLEFADNVDTGAKQVMIKKLTFGNLIPGDFYTFAPGSTWDGNNGTFTSGGSPYIKSDLNGEITLTNICENAEYNRGTTDMCEESFVDPVYAVTVFACGLATAQECEDNFSTSVFQQGRAILIIGAGAPSLDVPCSGTECLTAIGRVSTDPVGFIKNIFNFALGIAGGIAFLIMVYGAFKMITSSGNAEALQQGRELITSAVAGLLFIAFSVLLLKIIGVDILGLPGFSGPFVR